MKHSETLTKIAPDLVAALAHIGGAKKGKTNPAFKSRYADLESVIAASKEILADNGLTLIQFPSDCVSGVLNLETIFMHESGEWISGEMGIALGKTDPQGVGSALTYARRYAQMAALNMPAVDDDGERAMGRVNGAAAPAQPQSRQDPNSLAQKKRDGVMERMFAEIDATADMIELRQWWKDNTHAIKDLPQMWQDAISDRKEARKVELEVATAEAELDAGFRGAIGSGDPDRVAAGASAVA